MNDTGEPQDGHNSIPGGWLLFFFAAVIFLVWYIVAYTPAISGWSFYKKYEQEMAVAAKTKPAVTVNSFSGNEKAIAEGRDIYASNCAVCHKEDGTGGIGPNLTATLKYGSSEKEIFKSVAEGRPNGMPGFLPQLGAERTGKVVAFLEKLRKK
jgi:cytochrome c oxidase cbb3-type subunit 3